MSQFSFRRTAILAACAIGLAMSVSGCVATVRPAYYGGAVVTVAPPAPQVEVYGPPPFVGAVWFPGYWNWNGGAHVWVAGGWHEGRPGYRWVPHTWVREGGGWRMHEGHWAR
jgi:hypothetical protein